ncbi:glycolipid 2-alpha-mannosyltransferase [Coniella lustricola]|uniref:Glycolipid 2-alpha-mannosyltransferase n=1 Tax=Coniella lustricola TaxID=2025994 RepID=A0A2T3AME5_9PEZI|nr:glycolipid 2-alpha-mannosyltransferase [Coniella lustricola]
MFQSLPPPSRRLILICASIILPFAIEVFLHWRRFDIPRPGHDLDPPFYAGCQDPAALAAASNETDRPNAVLVMLARNSDIDDARHTVASVEDKFNRWFNYPYVFLNDQPWDPEFVRVLNQTARGNARFDVISHDDWTYPPSVDKEEARQSILEQGQRGIHYGGLESYHHMCRFFSGKFYTHEALQPFKWYWRLEPGVDFSCSITYDPFAEMARRGKVYGWTISLWEEPNTCPTLFRHVSDWKESQMIPTTPDSLWTAMIQASWLPYPFRRWMRWSPLHDQYGDVWSLCHYWSNFEIADLDFFRSRQYQGLFEYLDAKGGFYKERWGDAAVHSLAVGMLARTDQVHHFSDFAYRHGSFQQCPANALGEQLEGSIALGDGLYSQEKDGGVGCRCTCDSSKTINFPGYCTNKLKQPTRPDRPWLTWFL